MLTQKDLNEIEKIVDDKLDEKTKLLPSKDQFFSKMDEVMGELKAIREVGEITVRQHAQTWDIGYQGKVFPLQESFQVTS